MELSDRQKRILKFIIDEYINTAEPVGSKAIAEKWESSVSSATVRNEMSELQEMGLIDKPHTSAGRVPSHRGYRFYVDELMNIQKLSLPEIEEINRALSIRVNELDQLISEAGKLVAKLTNYTAFTVSPNLERALIRRIDIIPVDAHSFVLLVIADPSIVKNKMVRSPETINEDDLLVYARLINHSIVGMAISKITKEQLEKVLPNTPLAGVIIFEIMEFLSEISFESDSRHVYLGGATKLLQHPEYHDVEKASKLLEYLSDRHNITDFPIPQLDKPIQITIGSENTAEPLKEASIVCTSYHLRDGDFGLICVVGPTRMNYSKVAARLKLFAQGLSNLLFDDTDYNQ